MKSEQFQVSKVPCGRLFNLMSPWNRLFLIRGSQVQVLPGSPIISNSYLDCTFRRNGFAERWRNASAGPLSTALANVAFDQRAMLNLRIKSGVCADWPAHWLGPGQDTVTWMRAV